MVPLFETIDDLSTRRHNDGTLLEPRIQEHIRARGVCRNSRSYSNNPKDGGDSMLRVGIHKAQSR
jgi:phosphoenolpyruvate carboxylase